MNKLNDEITQAELKHILHYEPTTGVFTWKVARQSIKVGDIAGYLHRDGYHKIGINGKSYPAHRLAWLYVHGKFPPEFIDHINGIKTDNRIINLREATDQQNRMNAGKQSNNTSGFKGVSWCKQSRKWHVQIRHLDKAKHLGYFTDIQEAAIMYMIAADVFHGEFACY